MAIHVLSVAVHKIEADWGWIYVDITQHADYH